MKYSKILIIILCTAFLFISYLLAKSRIEKFQSDTSEKTSVSRQETPLELPSSQGQFVKINDTTIFVDIAKSESETQRGLSGRKPLEENQGLLFVFNNNSFSGFWMKDMLFPIDIIWITNGKIVGIEKDAQPEPGKPLSQLKIYYPPEAINFVLEVNAGSSDKFGIKIGDSIDLSHVQ